jgi:hypothetical protein
MVSCLPVGERNCEKGISGSFLHPMPARKDGGSKQSAPACFPFLEPAQCGSEDPHGYNRLGVKGVVLCESESTPSEILHQKVIPLP